MGGDNLLGDFIKARRGRVRAELPSYGRRRVPGLRREELARVAGVSVAYLTRLEQGVDRNPSAQVLDALAAALRLNPDETAHLHTLAGLPAPAGNAHPPTVAGPPAPTGNAHLHSLAGPPPPAGNAHSHSLAGLPAPAGNAGSDTLGGPLAPVGNAGVSEDIRQLVDSWGRTPAYVRDRRFDVLAANKPAMALSPIYTPGQNLVRGIFLDPAARRLFPDWTAIAAQTVAALRAEADLRDPATAELVAELSAEDSFRQLWANHDVRPVRDELKRFDHPAVGELALRRQALSIAGAEGQVIIVYQADPSSPSADALARLL